MIAALARSVIATQRIFTCLLYLLNTGNTKATCEICSNLTLKTPNDVVLMSLLLTLNVSHTWF